MTTITAVTVSPQCIATTLCHHTITLHFTDGSTRKRQANAYTILRKYGAYITEEQCVHLTISVNAYTTLNAIHADLNNGSADQSNGHRFGSNHGHRLPPRATSQPTTSDTLGPHGCGQDDASERLDH